MDEMDENKKRRIKILMRLLGIFVAVMLTLTFFSSTIQNFLLPEVTLMTPPTNGQLEINSAINSVMEYAETVDVKAPVSGVLTLMTTPNSASPIDTEIASITAADGTVTKITMPVNGTVISVNAAQSNTTQNSGAQGSTAQGSTATDNTAQNSGAQDITVQAGQSLFTIGNDDKGFIVRFQLDKDKADKMNALSSVRVYQYTPEGPTNETTFVERKDNAAEGVVDFTTSSLTTTKYTKNGEPVVVLLKWIVEQSRGNLIMPKSVVYDVTKNAMPTGTIYILREKTTLFGTEYYVQAVDISIVDSDAVYYSYSNSLGYGTDIIGTTTKPLYDGEKVRLATSEEAGE